MTLHPALEFLEHLDSSPDARFNIEHYTDVPKGVKKPKPDPLAGRHSDLTIAEVQNLLPALRAVNQKGAGIFVARNQCRGHRSEASVSRVRGVHADLDDTTPQQIEALCNLLPSSIIVHSSENGKCQMYWQLSDGEVLSKDEAKTINQSLVTHGADPAAVDVSRLLRLPGFLHMKYRDEGRTPMVNAEYSGDTYTADEIRRAFDPQPATKAIKSINTNVKPAPPAPSRQSPVLTAVATIMEARFPKLWGGDWQSAPMADGVLGYPSQSEADLALLGHIARACLKLGFGEGDLPSAVESIFGFSDLGMSNKWLSRHDYRVRSIEKAISGLKMLSMPKGSTGLILESHGDIRNARAFAHMAKYMFVYVSTRDRWLSWSDGKWQVCEKNEHVAFAKQVCGQILTAAGEVFAQDQEKGKRLVQEAMAAHTLTKINAMLDLAGSEPGMAVTERSLDCDPYLLGVENGAVDLRTGSYMKNLPDMYITRYCGAPYVEDVRCDRWTVFMDQIFEGDIETIESVQRLLGCTLLGLAGEEILVICYGHGSNGKSVFSNVIHKIMGGYAVTAPPSILMVRRAGDSGPRNDLAALAGARYVSINETQAGDRLDEQVVKLLAGREPISARFLHQEFFEFTPSFTPWLRTNHKPIIVGEDDGIWRRLVLVRFGRTFTDQEKDPDLENKLLAERDGILLWMIEGARKYLIDGVKLSPRMKAELATYRNESDLLGEFLSDHTVQDPSGKVRQQTLYELYTMWCRDCGVRPLSKKSFSQRLAERGHPEGKSGGTRYYLKLALPPPSSSTQGGVGGISGSLGNSLNEKSTEEKTQNSHTSCPTRPNAPTKPEASHAEA